MKNKKLFIFYQISFKLMKQKIYKMKTRILKNSKEKKKRTIEKKLQKMQII